jgi:hypothetical protein
MKNNGVLITIYEYYFITVRGVNGAAERNR